MSNSSSPEDPDDGSADHLRGVEDGAGCTEIWAYLSEQRGEGD